MKQTTLNALALPGAKTTKKGVKFVHSHLSYYGLKVSCRDSDTGVVKSVACRFCAVFGRENEPAVSVDGAKKRTTIKHFNVFRTDLYEKHLRTQHPHQWGRYVAVATYGEKEGVFSQARVANAETIPSQFASEPSIKFTMSRPIVETIIGDLLFNPKGMEGTTRARALALFSLVEKTDAGEDMLDEEGHEIEKEKVFQVEEKNATRFRLCVRYLARGASFRMAAGLIEDAKVETGVGLLGGCTESVAARCAKIVCAVSLDRLATVIPTAWAFSLAIDCATHQGKSYADVRCRFVVKGHLHNFHLLAIPMFERHTASYIFSLVARFLDALLPCWHDQLIGVATDGAATMTGNLGGLVTLMEAAATHSVVRVWCGLHQLDLKMQRIFESALNETYVSKLTALIGYLRRQYTLISDMGSTCPKVATTRWASMFEVSQWLCANGFAVRQYLEHKAASCAPSDVWWVFLFAIRDVANEASSVCVSLQGLSTLLYQQRDRFVGLVSRLCELSGMKRPLTSDELKSLQEQNHEVYGAFAFAQCDAKAYLQGCDMWVCETMETMDDESSTLVIRATARMFVFAASVISELPQAAVDAKPVTPAQLASTTMPQFLDLIKANRQRLLKHFGEEGIRGIGPEFKKLKTMYRDDPAFRRAIDTFDAPLASFNEIWAVGGAVNIFPQLVAFCGGVASVFPNTATVESDFSLVNSVKSDKKKRLTDLSLEGVLHCKQWDQIEVLMNQ